MQTLEKNNSKNIANAKLKKSVPLYIILSVLFAAYIFTFQTLKEQYEPWANVSPPPSDLFLKFQSFNDDALLYRSESLALQTAGDYGGRVQNLDTYNFDSLTQWFSVLTILNDEAQFIPYLASYYFGSAKDVENLRPLAAYLEETGLRNPKKYWRWMAHAVFLARHIIEDYDLAARYAKQLEAMYDPLTMPSWVAQMHYLVLDAKGEKEAALNLALALLETQADLGPQEIFQLTENICTRILEEPEAKRRKLCGDYFKFVERLK